MREPLVDAPYFMVKLIITRAGDECRQKFASRVKTLRLYGVFLRNQCSMRFPVRAHKLPSYILSFSDIGLSIGDKNALLGFRTPEYFIRASFHRFFSPGHLFSSNFTLTRREMHFRTSNRLKLDFFRSKFFFSIAFGNKEKKSLARGLCLVLLRGFSGFDSRLQR